MNALQAITSTTSTTKAALRICYLINNRQPDFVACHDLARRRQATGVITPAAKPHLRIGYEQGSSRWVGLFNSQGPTNIFAIGAPTTGVFYAVSNIDVLQMQAETIYRNLCALNT